MKKHVVNTSTGVTKDVDLTPDEEVAIMVLRNTPPVLSEDTPDQLSDIVRALVAKGTITPSDIAEAKRNR